MPAARESAALAALTPMPSCTPISCTGSSSSLHSSAFVYWLAGDPARAARMRRPWRSSSVSRSPPEDAQRLSAAEISDRPRSDRPAAAAIAADAAPHDERTCRARRAAPLRRDRSPACESPGRSPPARPAARRDCRRARVKAITPDTPHRKSVRRRRRRRRACPDQLSIRFRRWPPRIHEVRTSPQPVTAPIRPTARRPVDPGGPPTDAESRRGARSSPPRRRSASRRRTPSARGSTR